MKQEQDIQQLSRGVLFIVFGILGLSVFWLLRFFIAPVVLSAALCVIFYPLYSRLLNTLCRGYRNIASLLMIIMLLMVLFIPLYFLVQAGIDQTSDLFQNVQLSTTDESSLQWGHAWRQILNSADQLGISSERLQESLVDVLQSLSHMMTDVVTQTSRGTMEALMKLFLTFFTLFYFFRDGQLIVQYLKQLSPLKKEYEDRIIERFQLVTQATLKGTVIIGFVQGIVGGITLYLLGFKAWILWSIIMIVLSVIPVIGSYVVLVPAAIYLFLSGQILQAVIAIGVATILNYGIDYLLRPALVGHDSKVHDLIIFYATLGGLAVFGIMGFVVGPVIVVLFTAFIEIYSIEFKSDLDRANE